MKITIFLAAVVIFGTIDKVLLLTFNFRFTEQSLRDRKKRLAYKSEVITSMLHTTFQHHSLHIVSQSVSDDNMDRRERRGRNVKRENKVHVLPSGMRFLLSLT